MALFRSTLAYLLTACALAQAANPVASLPFKGGEQGRILIDVKINDHGPFPFFFDTGSVNIISLDLAKQLDVKMNGRRTLAAFGGTVETASAVLDSIKFGQITMGQTEILAIHGGPFTKGALVGMLGWEFLSKLVVEVDYEGGRLNFYDPKTYAYTGHGVRIPMTLQGNLMTVPGTVFGSAATLQLDTGSEHPLTLFTNFVETHHLKSKLQAVTGYGFGGLTRAMVTRAPALIIGGYAIQSPIAHLSMDKGGIESGSADGNIGGAILHAFTCVFDVPHSAFYLQPNRWFGKSELADRSGLVLDTRGQSAKVLFVYPGSPAAGSKIMDGDDLTDENGHSLTADQWHDLLDQPSGTTVQVTIRHEKQLRKVRLALRDYIPLSSSF